MSWRLLDEVDQTMLWYLLEVQDLTESLTNYLVSVNSLRPPSSPMERLGSYLLFCCTLKEATGKAVSKIEQSRRSCGTPLTPSADGSSVWTPSLGWGTEDGEPLNPSTESGGGNEEGVPRSGPTVR